MNHLLPFYLGLSPVSGVQSSDEDDTYLKEIMCDGKKYHSCTFPGCGKIYRYKSEFMRHTLSHTSQRPISCSFEGCTKTFKSEDALKSHMRMHTGETPYQCQEPNCGKSFSSKPALKYHSLRHKGEKEYKCSFPGCNKMFLNNSQLKQHENALNYHQKMITQTSPSTGTEEHGDSISKIRKIEDSLNSGSIHSEPNEIKKADYGVTVQCVTVKDENMNKEVDDQYKKMIMNLFFENSAMKMKLQIRDMMQGLMQGNADIKTKYSAFLDIKGQ